MNTEVLRGKLTFSDEAGGLSGLGRCYKWFESSEANATAESITSSGSPEARQLLQTHLRPPPPVSMSLTAMVSLHPCTQRGHELHVGPHLDTRAKQRLLALVSLKRFRTKSAHHSTVGMGATNELPRCFSPERRSSL